MRLYVNTQGNVNTVFLLYKLTRQDFLEQTPSWEVNRSSSNQEIPCILQNPNVHYRTHKRPPPVRILSHSHLVNDPILFLKFYYIILLSSTSKFSKWSPSLRSTHQIPLYALNVSQMCHFPYPSHSL
jgi:hypothetical protein